MKSAKFSLVVVLAFSLVGCSPLSLALMKKQPPTSALSVAPTQVLKPAKIGRAYSDSVKASGGVKPYSFVVLVGALPEGLQMDVVTGIITGTPVVKGTYTFQVQVTDQSQNF